MGLGNEKLNDYIFNKQKFRSRSISIHYLIKIE